MGFAARAMVFLRRKETKNKAFLKMTEKDFALNELQYVPKNTQKRRHSLG